MDRSTAPNLSLEANPTGFRSALPTADITPISTSVSAS